ncbi:MAG: hypothetical protein RRA32_11010, partial [bacterium]|nr:hypothetical protein [bacterium]
RIRKGAYMRGRGRIRKWAIGRGRKNKEETIDRPGMTRLGLSDYAVAGGSCWTPCPRVPASALPSVVNKLLPFLQGPRLSAVVLREG